MLHIIQEMNETWYIGTEIKTNMSAALQTKKTKLKNLAEALEDVNEHANPLKYIKKHWKCFEVP